jgi:UDP-N-acetylglucosamine--N-acetylmuramyl-(pentapeptide) pyrophosphoryl-undecaprenol N-acetylglucosamine transferase
MNEAGTVLVAAGGTGGHLFPAEALSNALAARGFAVELVTDKRAAKYSGAFPARAIHQLASATPASASLFARAKAILILMIGTYAAKRLVKRIRPVALVGFGGYPTVPPVLAATQFHVPTILHEANAVMGRANRFLAGRVDLIATGFAKLGGVSDEIRAKMQQTGNPVRPAVLAAAALPYPDFADGRLRLLVTGGSQGARVMSDIVPEAIALLDEPERKKLMIVQQARGEDEARVRDLYARLAVEAEVASFFTDLPKRIAEAHLVIARAGASTVSELAVIGRPSILVPYPHALDQDQAANAEELAATGAAIVIKQDGFTPAFLAARLKEALGDEEGLRQRAGAAKMAGIADAAERLANLVATLVSKKQPKEKA